MEGARPPEAGRSVVISSILAPPFRRPVLGSLVLDLDFCTPDFVGNGLRALINVPPYSELFLHPGLFLDDGFFSALFRLNGAILEDPLICCSWSVNWTTFHPHALLTEIHALLNRLLHNVGSNAHPAVANVAFPNLQLLFGYGNDLTFGGGGAHPCSDGLR